MKRNTTKLLILFAMLTATFGLGGQMARASVVDDQPISAQRWVVSELYDNPDGTKYVEFYNNSDNDSLGWGDYFANLPIDSNILELLEVFGFQHIKPHAFQTVDFSDTWYGVAAFNLLKQYGLDANAFSEIADALEERNDYSYQRCLYYRDGKPLMSDKFYYGKKTKGKEIDCSDSSLRPTNLMERAGMCQGLQINEIESYQQDDEQFVEVYNASERPIDLGMCYVGKSRDDADSSKAYSMDAETIAPGEFYTQYLNTDDMDLKLTERSGQVVLFDGDRQSELDSRRYSGMKEDTSYALGGDDDWHVTYDVTPDEPNQIEELKPCDEEGYVRNPSTNRCIEGTDNDEDEADKDSNSDDSSDWLSKLLGGSTSSSKSSSDGLVPCKEGYYRNPATNRCKKLTTSSSTTSGGSASAKSTTSTGATDGLVPCKEGYYRNPETNRCKKLVTSGSGTSSTGSSLVPCAAGYYRNPVTNRCKKLTTSNSSTTSTSQLTPCKEGYERNPETNRCRKIASTADSASTLKPCKEGYERNPETNRCRKKTSASSSDDKDGDAKYPVKTKEDERATDQSQLTLIIVLAVAGALTVIVIIWQYHQSIARGLRKIFGGNSKGVQDKIVRLSDEPQPKASDNPLFKSDYTVNDMETDPPDPSPIEFK